MSLQGDMIFSDSIPAIRKQSSLFIRDHLKRLFKTFSCVFSGECSKKNGHHFLTIYILYDTCYMCAIWVDGAIFPHLPGKPPDIFGKEGKSFKKSDIFVVRDILEKEMIVVKKKSLKLSAVSLVLFALILSVLSAQPVYAQGAASKRRRSCTPLPPPGKERESYGTGSPFSRLRTLSLKV